MLDSDPFTRNFLSGCESVATSSRTASGRMFCAHTCAQPRKNLCSGVKPSMSCGRGAIQSTPPPQQTSVRTESGSDQAGSPAARVQRFVIPRLECLHELLCLQTPLHISVCSFDQPHQSRGINVTFRSEFHMAHELASAFQQALGIGSLGATKEPDIDVSFYGIDIGECS